MMCSFSHWRCAVGKNKHIARQYFWKKDVSRSFSVGFPSLYFFRNIELCGITVLVTHFTSCSNAIKERPQTFHVVVFTPNCRNNCTHMPFPAVISWSNWPHTHTYSRPGCSRGLRSIRSTLPSSASFTNFPSFFYLTWLIVKIKTKAIQMLRLFGLGSIFNLRNNGPSLLSITQPPSRHSSTRLGQL